MQSLVLPNLLKVVNLFAVVAALGILKTILSQGKQQKMRMVRAVVPSVVASLVIAIEVKTLLLIWGAIVHWM